MRQPYVEVLECSLLGNEEASEGIGDVLVFRRSRGGLLCVRKFTQSFKTSRNIHLLDLALCPEQAAKEGPPLSLGQRPSAMLRYDRRSQGSLSTSSVQERLVGDNAAKDDAGQM